MYRYIYIYSLISKDIRGTGDATSPDAGPNPAQLRHLRHGRSLQIRLEALGPAGNGTPKW